MEKSRLSETTFYHSHPIYRIFHICKANISLRSNITCRTAANITGGSPLDEPPYGDFLEHHFRNQADMVENIDQNQKDKTHTHTEGCIRRAFF